MNSPKISCSNCGSGLIGTIKKQPEIGTIEEDCTCRRCGARWKNVFTYDRTIEYVTPGQFKVGQAADHIHPDIAEDD